MALFAGCTMNAQQQRMFAQFEGRYGVTPLEGALQVANDSRVYTCEVLFVADRPCEVTLCGETCSVEGYPGNYKGRVNIHGKSAGSYGWVAVSGDQGSQGRVPLKNGGFEVVKITDWGSRDGLTAPAPAVGQTYSSYQKYVPPKPVTGNLKISPPCTIFNATWDVAYGITSIGLFTAVELFNDSAVYVDGQKCGQAFYGYRLWGKRELSPGWHTIELIRRGKVLNKREFYIAAGKTTKIKLDSGETGLMIVGFHKPKYWKGYEPPQ